MGYVSDVGLVMYKNDFDDMLRRARVEGVDIADLIGGASRLCFYDTEDSIVVATRWEYVKWYDEFPDVRFIMDYIESVPSLYVRIGESSDDPIDVMYGPGDCWVFDEYLYPVREIRINTYGRTVPTGYVREVAAEDGSDIEEQGAPPLDDLLLPST